MKRGYAYPVMKYECPTCMEYQEVPDAWDYFDGASAPHEDDEGRYEKVKCKQCGHTHKIYIRTFC